MKVRWIASAVALAVGLSACGSDTQNVEQSGTGPNNAKVTLNLGYFPNVTHAPAVYGVQNGDFASTLGTDVNLKTSTYTAGPAAVEALFSGAIDAAFVGPGPASSAYSKSNGEAARVVAGVASGGAFLVVQPEITNAEGLKGKKIADPQLNGTQDIALRWYLKQHGYKTDTTGGGDVNVVPQENAQTLDAFKAKEIDGAWVPEPWATRLVDAGGKVLVDERDEWPDKAFVTTVLIVSPKYLKAHPDVVKKLIEATQNAIDAINDDPDKAAEVVSQGIEKITTKPIKVELVTASFKSIAFTLDPLAATLRTVADHAVQLELAKPTDLSGLFDLTLLNEVLKANGQPEVEA